MGRRPALCALALAAPEDAFDGGSIGAAEARRELAAALGFEEKAAQRAPTPGLFLLVGRPARDGSMVNLVGGATAR